MSMNNDNNTADTETTEDTKGEGFDSFDDDDSTDECDACGSSDVEYPYTSMGYLCGCCRHSYRLQFSDIHSACSAY